MGELTEIRGIGPATAGRLERAGIPDLETLAEASVDQVQDAMSGDAPAGVAEGWITEAVSMLETLEPESEGIVESMTVVGPAEEELEAASAWDGCLVACGDQTWVVEAAVRRLVPDQRTQQWLRGTLHYPLQVESDSEAFFADTEEGKPWPARSPGS